MIFKFRTKKPQNYACKGNLCANVCSISYSIIFMCIYIYIPNVYKECNVDAHSNLHNCDQQTLKRIWHPARYPVWVDPCFNKYWHFLTTPFLVGNSKIGYWNVSNKIPRTHKHFLHHVASKMDVSLLSGFDMMQRRRTTFFEPGAVCGIWTGHLSFLNLKNALAHMRLSGIRTVGKNPSQGFMFLKM